MIENKGNTTANKETKQEQAERLLKTVVFSEFDTVTVEFGSYDNAKVIVDDVFEFNIQLSVIPDIARIIKLKDMRRCDLSHAIRKATEVMKATVTNAVTEDDGDGDTDTDKAVENESK